MPEQYIPLETYVSVISGRDAIYLTEFAYAPSASTITLRGGLNGHLCSRNEPGARWLPCELILLGVFAFQMIEVDLSGWRGESSFDEVRDSAWLRQLHTHATNTKLTPRHKHFFIATYDDVFDVIAKSYQLLATPVTDGEL